MLVFSKVCGNVNLVCSDLHVLQLHLHVQWTCFLQLCFLPGKRLALWASLCFAIRLAVASKKMEETGEGWNGQRVESVDLLLSSMLQCGKFLEKVHITYS